MGYILTFISYLCCIGMSSSSLSNVVSTLVRASMGTSVPSTVTDEELDRHVAELILKEAKQKAQQYLEHGVKAYLPDSGYAFYSLYAPTSIRHLFMNSGPMKDNPVQINDSSLPLYAIQTNIIKPYYELRRRQLRKFGPRKRNMKGAKGGQGPRKRLRRNV